MAQPHTIYQPKNLLRSPACSPLFPACLQKKQQQWDSAHWGNWWFAGAKYICRGENPISLLGRAKSLDGGGVVLCDITKGRSRQKVQWMRFSFVYAECADQVHVQSFV